MKTKEVEHGRHIIVKDHGDVFEFEIVSDRVTALYEVVDEIEELLKTNVRRRYTGTIEAVRTSD